MTPSSKAICESLRYAPRVASDIAACVGRTPPNVGACLANMRRAGLVERCDVTGKWSLTDVGRLALGGRCLYD